MKLLNRRIEICNTCPYCDPNKALKLCGKVNRTIPDNKIPEWCPLPNFESAEPVRVGTTAIIVRDGKILWGLRGEGCETAPGKRAFPGGRADYSEDAGDTIIREVEEETTLIVTKENMIFLGYVNEFFPESYKHYHSLRFLFWNSKGEPTVPEKEKDKCKGWEWNDPKTPPKDAFQPCLDSIEKYKHEINWAIMNEYATNHDFLKEGETPEQAMERFAKKSF